MMLGWMVLPFFWCVWVVPRVVILRVLLHTSGLFPRGGCLAQFVTAPIWAMRSGEDWVLGMPNCYR
jgi:hypothetical protein